MMIMNNLSKLKYLKLLQEIQQEIEVLEKESKKPQLELNVSSTSVFRKEPEDALSWIHDVIKGKKEPEYLPTRDPLKIPMSSISFWESFGKYCYEMIEYIQYGEEKKEKLKQLHHDEKIFKEMLNIK